MKQATPAIQDLARLLLAQEVDPGDPSAEAAHTAVRGFEKLRLYLSKLVGVGGFQALLARALALATVEVTWLETVRVQEDATLHGFTAAAQRQLGKSITAGSVALLSQLLGLLVIFIGEALTLRLVQDIWPEVQAHKEHLEKKETPA